jgi:sugar phosphate isomerase/epimerase
MVNGARMSPERGAVESTHHGHKAPRVSLGSWAFSFGPFESEPWSFDRFAEYTAATGYDGVEINGFRPHPHDADHSAEEVRRLVDGLAERGLGVSGFAPDLRSTPPAEASESEYLARIASIAAFCGAGSIPTVRVDTITPPNGPADSHVAAYRRLVTTWRRSAEMLANRGIQLVWEFEPGFWINRPSQVRRLLEDVDHTNFGLLFDTSHAHTIAAHGRRQGPEPELLDGGAAGFAALVAPWVRHLHLIDSDGSLHDEDTSVHLPFGRGEVDFAAVLSGLGENAARLPWWTVDYCFWPATAQDAATGAETVREIRDSFLETVDDEGETK